MKALGAILVAAAVLLLPALQPVAEAADAGAAATKKKPAKKRAACKKGYVRKTVNVKRKGKTVRVKKCVKKPAAKKKSAAPTPTPTPVPPPPAPGPPAAPRLFDPPGSRLVGDAARPFLERYLLNSTFTDCPAGWPNCAVEERYGHFANGAFSYCRLTPTSGSDIRFNSTYAIQNAVVEADGSWTFNEQIDNNAPSFYEWHVATDGTVTGAYQYNGGALQQIGPLRYVSGARDCSY